jgi:hypothetical protein
MERFHARPATPDRYHRAPEKPLLCAAFLFLISVLNWQDQMRQAPIVAALFLFLFLQDVQIVVSYLSGATFGAKPMFGPENRLNAAESRG